MSLGFDVFLQYGSFIYQSFLLCLGIFFCKIYGNSKISFEYIFVQIRFFRKNMINVSIRDYKFDMPKHIFRPKAIMLALQSNCTFDNGLHITVVLHQTILPEIIDQYYLWILLIDLHVLHCLKMTFLTFFSVIYTIFYYILVSILGM